MGIVQRIDARADEVDALARTDLRTFMELAFGVVRPTMKFKPAGYLDALAYELTEFAEGRTKRLIVNIPPRYLKSFFCSIVLPAWLMGRNPALRVVCVSYSNDLSRAHANAFRTLVKSPRYRRIFPAVRFGASKDTELEITTSKQGARISTSVEGTLTGRGGDVIIIDDPINTNDAYSDAALESCINWYRRTASTRLDDKVNGRMLLVMQRLHVNDLSGFLIATENWKPVVYAAIAEDWEVHTTCGRERWTREPEDLLHPEHEPLDEVIAAKKRLGSSDFAAQYQQSPVPIEGNMIKRDWFKTYSEPPAKTPGDIILQSWDTASKDGAQHDYSVCVTALQCGQNFYILDVYRAHINFADLQRAVIRLADRFKPQVILIEDAGSGTHVSAQLAAGTGVKAIPVRPEGSKVQRVHRLEGLLESGCVFLPRSAGWRGEFLDEMAAFPKVRHDDQVDALTQLLEWAERKRRTAESTQVAIGMNVKDERTLEERLSAISPGLSTACGPSSPFGGTGECRVAMWPGGPLQ